MYKYTLFNPLGIRLKWEVNTSNDSSNKSVRLDIGTWSVAFQHKMEKYL